MSVVLVLWAFFVGGVVCYRKPIMAFIKSRQKALEENYKREAELERSRRISREMEGERSREEREAETKRLADEWKADLDEKIYKHRFNLIQEEKRHTSYDAYGNEDSTWVDWDEVIRLTQDEITQELAEYNDNIFTSGLGYFWRHVILNDPHDSTHYFKGWRAFRETYKPACPATGRTYNRPDDWLTYLCSQVIHVTVEAESENTDVESMTGLEYEQYCKSLFELNGWDVIETPKSGDQGVDLIGTMGDMRLCIQCKRYNKPVGNSAIQQVAAGKVHYNGTYAAVVTNAGFTAAARELASSTEVNLWSTEEFASIVNLDDEDEEDDEE